MKFYSTIQEVNLDTAIIEQARKFANDVVTTIDYADSNQTSLKKIQFDHFISKLGEEAVAIVLSEYTKVEGPDYTIYAAKEKSWKSDLRIGDTGVAVKTQARSSANKYTLSWVFQCSEKRRDTILHAPDDWVFFVECNDLDRYHCYVYPPFQIKQLVFKEPQKSYLRGRKKVVYAATLPL